MDAIKNTSSNSRRPDNLYGWGIPDAEKAVKYYGPAFSNLPNITCNSNEIEINTFAFSSYELDKPSVTLHLIRMDSLETTYSMKEIDENHFSCSIFKKDFSNELDFYFTAKDKNGQLTRFPSGFLGKHFVYDLNKNKLVEVLN